MNGIKMPTITVTAPDTALAMDEVVRQLGSEAYILSTTKQDGLVQIKASIDPLNSAPRHPKTVKTVFEEEMEKQFSVTTESPARTPEEASAEILELHPFGNGSTTPTETRSEQAAAQHTKTDRTEPRARIEPKLKVAQSQPEPSTTAHCSRNKQKHRGAPHETRGKIKTDSPTRPSGINYRRGRYNDGRLSWPCPV